ncbi:MAG: hypothetical protein V1839_03315 [archaeon]
MLEDAFNDNLTLAEIKERIVAAAKGGDPFIIENDLLQAYKHRGGKPEDLKETLVTAYALGYKNELKVAEKFARDHSFISVHIALERAENYYNSLIKLDPSKKLEKGISAEIERIQGIFEQAKS